ncbi:hypothetical protein [Methylocaldum szegediense]|nr:hypothetical protein [Methylocaldum szegediense]
MNTIKHWEQYIGREEHHDDDTVPMWLTNASLVTWEASLTYEELAALL